GAVCLALANHLDEQRFGFVKRRGHLLHDLRVEDGQFGGTAYNETSSFALHAASKPGIEHQRTAYAVTPGLRRAQDGSERFPAFHSFALKGGQENCLLV